MVRQTTGPALDRLVAILHASLRQPSAGASCRETGAERVWPSLPLPD